MKRIYRLLWVVIGCACLLGAFELWLRSELFRHASYSNSASIDQQLRERDATPHWDIVFFGNSEVRWGLNPSEIDAAFRRSGLALNSFNHAFDGFDVSWWPLLLAHFLEQSAFDKTQWVAVGIQLIDGHRVIEGASNDCGALQRPVLTSAFAMDLGVDQLCNRTTWDQRLASRLFQHFWSVRYASSVRSMVLPEIFKDERLTFNSRKEGLGFRGYEPHRPIEGGRENFDDEFARWRAQYVPERDFVPLQPEIWNQLVAPAGFFDRLNNVVSTRNRRLILFSLPTNPLVIDTFKRRNDYLRNSKLLRAWAQDRGVVYVDLGIQDVPNPKRYFSDMRHLSSYGASIWSRALGEALAAHPDFRKNISQ